MNLNKNFLSTLSFKNGLKSHLLAVLSSRLKGPSYSVSELRNSSGYNKGWEMRSGEKRRQKDVTVNLDIMMTLVYSTRWLFVNVIK